MKTTPQAFLDNVIIKPDPTPSKTEGGVHIPESARIVPLTGTVVNVGQGKFAEHTGIFIPTTLKKGQRVLHKKFQTTEIDFEGERHLIMKESNIDAIL